MERLLTQLRKGRFDQQSANVIELNKELRNLLSHVSRNKPIPIFKDCEERLIVSFNSDRFVSVIEHLVRNAQEATNEETGKIAIQLSRRDGNAVIEVKDNGCGMDSDFIESRLFKPFDTTKGNAGMGIGVYQSKQLVANAGGQMEVQSKPGEGTLVRIMLPLQSH